ncbi:hypothetical protein P4H27_25950 [Paenibacillus taichungensis]|uniref:hypothetical protein n=1 Tax=Paenibacillus taichungensis TaxID=484184 RepID=UPI002DB63E77|nr:hypothetical protein [Paenibacillus taichungensis]MEC0110418.1 hypothetical protein [Paenibacillus taichungensis]MEC0200094.1 hypothetical protein [Paenibacillus taichungensis]
MIRQEKRKRRWLEKNGFTFVADEPTIFKVFMAERYGRDWNTDGYYAFQVVRLHNYDRDVLYTWSIYELNEPLHKIKLRYYKDLTGSYPTSGLTKLFKSTRSTVFGFKNQLHALIKHGINPWW